MSEPTHLVIEGVHVPLAEIDAARNGEEIAHVVAAHTGGRACGNVVKLPNGSIYMATKPARKSRPETWSVMSIWR